MRDKEATPIFTIIIPIGNIKIGNIKKANNMRLPKSRKSLLTKFGPILSTVTTLVTGEAKGKEMTVERVGPNFAGELH